jgi:hypothetical protein
VVRGHDRKTSVKVAITAPPDTTYHFFLKCVRILGNVKIDDEGIAIGIGRRAIRGVREAVLLLAGQGVSKQIEYRIFVIFTAIVPALIDTAQAGAGGVGKRPGKLWRMAGNIELGIGRSGRI